MDVIFVRHELSATEVILQELWDLGLIALQDQDSGRGAPVDFDLSGRNALERLWGYCDEGVIACASYQQIQPSALLLGTIRKGSQISTRRYDPYLYRVVRLEGIREISYEDYPLLADIQPSGESICRWPAAQEQIRSIYSGQPLAREISSLKPGQLEVLCYEYMRLQGYVSHLVLPLGQNQMQIDICGQGSGGKLVLAQVSAADCLEENSEKIQQLAGFRERRGSLVYFGPRRFQGLENGVVYIPVEEVFDHFAAAPAGSTENKLLASMLRERTIQK